MDIKKLKLEFANIEAENITSADRDRINGFLRKLSQQELRNLFRAKIKIISRMCLNLINAKDARILLAEIKGI